MTHGKGAAPPKTTPHHRNINTTDTTQRADGCHGTGGNRQGEGGGGQIGFAALLELLGHSEGEFTAVCHRPADGGVFSSSVLESCNASGHVKGLPAGCTWFSVNPTKGPQRHRSGRGTERDVTRWAALYLDLDVKKGAFPDLDKAAEFVGALSGMVGSRPSVLIRSGHGLQPLWPIEDGQLDNEVKWARAYRLSRRFGRLAARVASEFAASLDTVADLSRVLRVPGTTNWKNPDRPAEAYAIAGGGGPLTVDRVEEFLDEWAPEIESDRQVDGEVLSPVEGWEFGAATCPYAAKMVSSWGQESDRPRAGRHQWAMSRCVRLAAAHRLGCITEEDLTASLHALDTALSHWCKVVGAPRELAPDEVGSAFRWAQAKVSTFVTERVRQELGDHGHARSWEAAGKDHADFWELTDTLRHIRDFARARRVAPWAMLGVVLAHVVTTIPPSVQIPPLVGGRASLNFYVGLVGESGKGKGAPERAARDAFHLKGFYSTGIGSGEGINHLFAHYDKKAGGTVMDRDAVLFSVPEIDTLAALGQRNASTLLPQLRKAWSGEALSFGYATKDKALVIGEHVYRLTLVAGIQPGRAGALLDDVDGGTPQRFLWMPTVDPDAPEEKPSEPHPIDLTGAANGWPPTFGVDPAGRSGPYEFQLPAEALDLVDRSRLAALRDEGTSSALDGHLLLCRIKVAVALALLHDCREVTSQFWEMSEVVMAVSQASRRGVETELAHRNEQQNRARGKAEGIRAVAAEEIREDAVVKRVTQAILRQLEKLGGSGSRSAVRGAVAHRDRPDFDFAVERLEAAGQVEVDRVCRGLVLRLTGRR